MEGSGGNPDEFKQCGHNEYMVYCQHHEIILCLECALSDHQNCGGQKAKTLRQSATDQVAKFEEILQICKEHQS